MERHDTNYGVVEVKFGLMSRVLDRSRRRLCSNRRRKPGPNLDSWLVKRVTYVMESGTITEYGLDHLGSRSVSAKYSCT